MNKNIASTYQNTFAFLSFKSMEPKRDGHVGLVFPTSPSPLIDFFLIMELHGFEL